MRANQYSLAKIAERVGANSRQAIAKALASIPTRFRFDVASHAIGSRNIDRPTSIAETAARSRVGSTTRIQFMELVGPVVTMALQDSDVVDILLNDDGSRWADSRFVGMKKIGSMPALDAERIIQFANDNFNKELESDEEMMMAEISFANARFTGLLPPAVERPFFAVRKGGTSLGDSGSLEFCLLYRNTLQK